MQLQSSSQWTPIIENCDLIRIIMCFTDNQSLARFSLSNRFTLQVFHEINRNYLPLLRVQYLNQARGDLMDSSLIDLFSCLSHVTSIDGIVTSLNEFKQNLHRLVKSTIYTKVDSVKSSDCMSSLFLEYLETEDGQKSPFVISGGLLTAALFREQNVERFKKNKYSDVDVFTIRNKLPNYSKIASINEFSVLEKSSEVILRSTLKELYSKFDKQYICCYFGNTIELIQKDDHRRVIQFTLRQVESVEDLLCFFDLDCVRFAYDGQRVWTTRSGIHYLCTKMNYVQKEKQTEPGLDFKRFVYRTKKYEKRGFPTVFYSGHPAYEINYYNSNWIETYTSTKYLTSHLNPEALEIEEEFRINVDNDKAYHKTVKTYDYLSNYTTNEPYAKAMVMKDLAKRYPGYIDSGLSLNIEKFLTALPSGIFIRNDVRQYNYQSLNIYNCSCCSKFYYRKYKYSVINAVSEDKLCPNCSYHYIAAADLILRRRLAGSIAVVLQAQRKQGLELCLKLLSYGVTVVCQVDDYQNALNRFIYEMSETEPFTILSKDSCLPENLYLYQTSLFNASGLLDFTAYVEREFGRVDLIVTMHTEFLDEPRFQFNEARNLVTYYPPENIDTLKRKVYDLSDSLPSKIQRTEEHLDQTLLNDCATSTMLVISELYLHPLSMNYPSDHKKRIINFIYNWQRTDVREAIYDIEDLCEGADDIHLVTYDLNEHSHLKTKGLYLIKLLERAFQLPELGATQFLSLSTNNFPRTYPDLAISFSEGNKADFPFAW
jgi:hypothetical protein